MFNPVSGTGEKQMGTAAAPQSGFQAVVSLTQVLLPGTPRPLLWNIAIIKLKSTQLVNLTAKDLWILFLNLSSISSLLFFRWKLLEANSITWPWASLVPVCGNTREITLLHALMFLQYSGQKQTCIVFTIIILCWPACMLRKSTQRNKSMREAENVSQSSGEKYYWVSFIGVLINSYILSISARGIS